MFSLKEIIFLTLHNGRTYIRVEDENRQLSAKELESMFVKKNIDLS